MDLNQILINQFFNEPMAAYHASTAFSKTQLAAAHKTNWDVFYWTYIAPVSELIPEKQTSASMKFGTLVHTAILEPHLLDQEYVVNEDGLSKQSKAFKQLEADNPGKEIISRLHLDYANFIVERIASNDKFARLFADGMPEQSCYFMDETTGLSLKCRPDFLIPNRDIVIDVKTAVSANPKKFSYACADFDYHLSVALTARGYKAAYNRPLKEYIFFVVENSYPFTMAAYVLDSDAILKASRVLDHALDGLKRCMDSGVWPGYVVEDEIEVISLPHWKL